MSKRSSPPKQCESRLKTRPQRQPLRTMIDFVELSLACDTAGRHSPLQMITEPIAECLDDGELHGLLRALSRIKRMCETELADRHAQRRLQ